MSDLVDAVLDWPLWDIGWRDWAILGALLVVVLQHGGTAGIHAAMGRDGMIDHRRAERIGAWRGTVTLVALMGPVFVFWAFDAMSAPTRLAAYTQANLAIIAVYGPVTVVAFAAFLLARVTPWQVRSNLNSVVLGTLEFLRPWLAAVGMAAGILLAGDPMVAAVGTLAVIAGIAVGPATRRWWYSRPVRLEDLGAAAPASSA